MDRAAAQPGRLRAGLCGAGWLALAAAPAALIQAFAILDEPAAALLGVPVLMGGRSVVAAFEATVETVMGDRSDTMWSGATWYFALTAAQVLVLSALLAWRRRSRGRWREPVVVLVLAAAAGNAALAITWPWWGT